MKGKKSIRGGEMRKEKGKRKKVKGQDGNLARGRPSGRPSGSAALAGMEEVRKRLGYGRDDAGFTVQEYAERYKLIYQTAAGDLRRMAEKGDLLQGWARRPSADRKIRRVKVYRPA